MGWSCLKTTSPAMYGTEESPRMIRNHTDLEGRRTGQHADKLYISVTMATKT